MLSYVELLGFWRKGLRNGSWYRLGVLERVFYRAAAWYARKRSKIVNNKIIGQLKDIAEKLKTTIRRKIINAAMERMRVMTNKFEDSGVFKWAPQLRTWLKDHTYIFWLGLNSQPPHNDWII